MYFYWTTVSDSTLPLPTVVVNILIYKQIMRIIETNNFVSCVYVCDIRT